MSPPPRAPRHRAPQQKHPLRTTRFLLVFSVWIVAFLFIVSLNLRTGILSIIELSSFLSTQNQTSGNNRTHIGGAIPVSWDDPRLHPLDSPILLDYVSKQWLRNAQNTITSNTNDARLATTLHSDVVELRHCSLDRINATKFTAWANPILEIVRPTYRSSLQNSQTNLANSNVWNETILPELALELLEIFATHEGHCNFTNYPLDSIISPHQSTASSSAAATAAASVLSAVPSDPDGLPRFAIVIVAYKDAIHLDHLIRALHLPHHLIIIHLERSTPPSYFNQIAKIAALYSNVVILQFGTILYRTDSISMINYQIMNWLVNDLRLAYDYHFTLGGTVFPLQSAIKMCRNLQTTPRNNVWMGELLHNGKTPPEGYAQWGYMTRKRLMYTSGPAAHQSLKLIQRIKHLNQGGFQPTLPEFIMGNMTKKTNSGNQAVFSFEFVKKLVDSPHVKELFATAKYSCCCCVEERTWIAAASMIGFRKQAMETTSMFQVWGGTADCRSTMNNAMLELDPKKCFKLEDALLAEAHNKSSLKKGDPHFFRGDELFQLLTIAKDRGYMLARKFNSSFQVLWS